jgi:aspartyl-tRNA(Asn)/glutamyl-tRNA(Gln) amidotransferase subunit C
MIYFSTFVKNIVLPMTIVDQNLISKLETLARLKLEDSEKERLAIDLTNILGMVEKLQSLNTDGVEPLTYISEEINVWREDEVKNQVSRAEAFRNAPDFNDEHFKVPKVIIKK